MSALFRERRAIYEVEAELTQSLILSLALSLRRVLIDATPRNPKYKKSIGQNIK